MPFHTSDLPPAMIALGVIGWIVVLRIVFLMREGIRWGLLSLVKVFVGFALATMISQAMGAQQQEAMLVGGLGAAIGAAMNKRRPRRIPKSIRRRVIERDLKGEVFDGRKHHIDHVWPFARGGSHTSDNLRVITKSKNLQKGARKPPIKDLFF